MHRSSEVVVPIHIHVGVEGWLQIRITLADVERVGGIGHVEKVGHFGLTRRTTIADAKCVLPVETIAEVECWGNTPVVAACNGVKSLIVVVNLLILLLNIYTYIHIDCSGDETELEFKQMGFILIVGISTQFVIEVISVIVWQIACSDTSNGIEENDLITQVVSRTIGMTFLIAEAILCLQEQLASNERLGIIGANAIVLVGIRCCAIAIGKTSRIDKLKIFNIAQIVAFALAVGIAAVSTNAEITSEVVQTTIENEIGTNVVVIAFRAVSSVV